MPLSWQWAWQPGALRQQTDFSLLDLGPSVLVALYEASAPETLFSDTAGTTLAADGVNVARWNDRSGNGNHVTQATLSNRPTRSAAAGVLTFDGGDRFTAVVFAGGTKAQSFSAACVGTITNANGMFFDNNSPRWLAQRGSTSTTFQIHTGSTLATTTAPDVGSQRRAYYLEYAGASSKIYSGGVLQTTGAAGANGAAGFGIGGTVASFPTGDIGMVAVFSRLLTAQEQALLYAYQQANWPGVLPMALVRFWAVVNGPNLAAAQGALAALGPEWEGSPSTPYVEPPLYDFESIKVYWDGWQIEEGLAQQAEALLASVPGCLTYRGPVYGLEGESSPGIMQVAEALAADPAPGPLVKMARNAALALGYRAFGHGNLPVESIAPSS